MTAQLPATVQPVKQRKKMPRSPGRPKGVPNKATATLKDAILLAAEKTGEDGKGKSGLVGYLKRVAKEDVKAFSSLLGRVLPLTVQGDPNQPIEHHITVNFVQAHGRAGPPTIDVTPNGANGHANGNGHAAITANTD